MPPSTPWRFRWKVNCEAVRRHLLILEHFMKTDLTSCAAALRALGEGTRLRIISLLLGRPSNVGDMVTALRLAQYNLSRHLRVLREAGLLRVVKQGQFRIYTVEPEYLAVDLRGQVYLNLGYGELFFDDAWPEPLPAAPDARV